MRRPLQFTIKKFIIAGSMIAFIMPALPALAADTAVIDNTGAQAATTGGAGTITTTPPPTPPASSLVDPTVLPPSTPPTDPLITTPPALTDTTVPADKPLTPPMDTISIQAPIVQTDPIVSASQTPPDIQNTSGVDNQLTSTAVSGNANVDHNTAAGSATTGDAAAIATLINMLQSSVSFDGSNLITFTKDVGDFNHDIYIDPEALAVINQAIAKKPENNLSISSGTDAVINNNISLNATSGDAGVDHNTLAGDATSGNANALLNLINIINSLAAARQSFVGTINIYGNLNGDILLPQYMIDALIASNAGGGLGGDVNANITDTMGINNNISQTATSGEASVDHNTSAGGATTGNALTKLTILNLTNRQIIGSDAILVFVNVLGHWVGMIVDAPTGATAAALGNTGGSGSFADSGVGDIQLNSSAQINNNISLAATSGNATVNHNRKAGNATTGDATTSVNLINIINSQISLSNFFGILFINVYGNWNGSFGVNTLAGDPPEVLGDTTTLPLITVIPHVESLNTKSNSPHVFFSSTQTSNNESDESHGSGLGFTIDGGNMPTISAVHANYAMILAAIGGMACFGLLGVVEQRRKSHYSHLDNQIVFPSF